MTNEHLRREVRILKALNDVTYGELGQMMNLSRTTIYNWLNGQFDFGKNRTRELIDLVAILKGE